MFVFISSISNDSQITNYKRIDYFWNKKKEGIIGCGTRLFHWKYYKHTMLNEPKYRCTFFILSFCSQYRLLITWSWPDSRNLGKFLISAKNNLTKNNPRISNFKMWNYPQLYFIICILFHRKNEKPL